MKADLDPSVFPYFENFVKLRHPSKFYDTKSHIAGKNQILVHLCPMPNSITCICLGRGDPRQNS